MKRVFVGVLFFAILAKAESLNSIIDYALKHSPVVRSSIADIKAAQYKRKSAQASKFGEIDLVGSVTHYNIERTLAPLPPSAMKSPTPITTTKDIYSIGVNYSVALFTGFAQTEAIKISSLAATMAKAKLRLTKEQVVFNIKSLYLSILAQQELLNAQYSYLKALKRLNSIIKQEVKLGRKAQIDAIKMESEIYATNAQIEALKANINITKATLSSLVGKKITKVNRLKIRVKRPRYSVQRLYTKVLSLNKIKLEDMALLKAKHQIKKAKAAKYPQVALNAYAGKNYGQDIHTDNWDNESIWQVGVNVKYNLIDFGKTNAQIEEAKVERLKAAIKKEQTMLDIKKQIIEATQKIKLSYANYISDSSNYKVSKKAQEIEYVRYKNELSTINDLLLAKARANLALAKLIESKYNYKKSIYYLDYVMERGVK